MQIYNQDLEKFSDSFRLYDLKVSIVGNPEEFACNHQVNDEIRMEGEIMKFNKTNSFTIYSLATLLPLLTAKQRISDAHDWINHDDLIACPDPHCKAKFKIERTGIRYFRFADTSGIAFSNKKSKNNP